MPRPRFAALDAPKRDAILAAAAEEFGRHGFDGASYNRIIVRAGVSKGAMYYYFDDKADLYLTVLREALEQGVAFVGELPPFDDAPGFWDALLVLYRRVIDFVASRPHAAGLVKAALASARVAVIGEAVDAYLARARTYFHRLLERGAAVGAVRDDLPVEFLVELAFALGDASDRWMLSRLDALAPGELEAYPAQALRIQLRVLAPLALVNELDAERPLPQGGRS